VASVVKQHHGLTSRNPVDTSLNGLGGTVKFVWGVTWIDSSIRPADMFCESTEAMFFTVQQLWRYRR
jgi:hypothetical protein